MYNKFITLAALLFGFFVAGTASAGEATDWVKSKQTELFKVAGEAKSDARDKKLNALFDEMIAYDEFCKASLGEQWGKRSADEQKQFCNLLTELVRENYKKNIHKLVNYEVTYKGEDTADGVTTVKTSNKHKSKADEPELDVDFRTKKIGSKWKVIDIVTERASMVKTFRSQFTKVLKEKDFPTLIAKMQKKLDKIRKKEEDKES
jgi:phospholipid transport system substrate-binding protein